MTPQHLDAYTRPECYMGETFPGTFVVYGVHRDSDSVVRSNRRVLLNTFKSQIGDREDGAPLFITRAGHFAVGWVDTLRLAGDADPALMAQLDTLIGGLDDYPLLDEDDHSELEWTEASDYWAQMSVSERVTYLQRADLCIFGARRDELPQDDDQGRLFELLNGY